ncbi:SLC13 family permease [Paenibacillus sp.]|uniref:SLC13 family permease n=1 Tax=Paenibacillus sp. TaxID=58172 RepID=UPI002D55DCB4|nr:SLC13 family permease [Paenibacillus sp.]HZG88102.1 SLC13 family permease [Paenibacillus sp.]
MEDVNQLPEPVAEFLLWCSAFPVVGAALVAHKFGFEAERQRTRYAQVRSWLQPDRRLEGCYALDKETRALLRNEAASRYGYPALRQWTIDAIAFYLEAGHDLAAWALYVEQDDWPAALRVLDGARARIGANAKDAAFASLKNCPLPLLASHYELMLDYLEYCAASEPEHGIALVECAIDTQAAAYSVSQRIAVYERGAELSNRAGKDRHAVEYLQLAERLLASSEQGGRRAAEEGYDRARQKLDREKHQRLAEGASRLFKKDRMTGWFALLAAAIVIALSYVVPPAAGLSPKAMVFAGVGVAAVILWVVNVVPDYIVALGMLMYWVLGGLLEPEVAFSGFASTTWFYMIFIMALSAAIVKSGILYRFALHALQRFPPHYRGQLWGAVAGGILLNPLIPSSSAKVTLGVPIARTLSESMGFAERSRGAAGLGLTAMIFYGFTAPFVLTGSYTNMMAYGLVSGSAGDIAWLQWLLYALPAFLVFCLILAGSLFVRFGGTQAGRPISADVLAEQLRLIGPLSKDEAVSLATVLGCVGLMILQPWHGVDSAWVMLAGFAVLVVTGALDRQTISTGIDWTFLLFLGVAFGFAGGVNELGITEALSSFLGAHLSAFLGSPYVFLLAVVAVSFAVTIVVRDDPAVILLVTALLPLAQEAGVHPWILVFVILLGTDPFFFTYQSPTYLTAYYSTEGKAFTHAQGQKLALLYAAAVVAAVTASVPYWRWIGLIQ